MPQSLIGAPRVQEAARARSTHPTDPPISTRTGFVYADPLPTATELQGSLPVDELPLEKHHHGPYELDRLLNAQKQESRLQEPPELTGIPAPCIIRTLQPFLWFPELHTPPCSSCCWREMASPFQNRHNFPSGSHAHGPSRGAENVDVTTEEPQLLSQRHDNSKASLGAISTFAESYSALQRIRKSRANLCDSTRSSALHKFSLPLWFYGLKFRCQANTTHAWPRSHQSQPHPDPSSVGLNASWDHWDSQDQLIV